MKADVLRLLGQSEECVRKGLFSQEEYDQARFAVCAWADEAILSSGWKEKAQWQREQLQQTLLPDHGSRRGVLRASERGGLPAAGGPGSVLPVSGTGFHGAALQPRR